MELKDGSSGSWQRDQSRNQNENENLGSGSEKQLGGQLDSASMSFFSSPAAEVESGDESDGDEGGQLFDGSSVDVLDAEVSDADLSEGQFSVVVKDHVPEPSVVVTSRSSSETSAPITSPEYIDLTGSDPQDPCAESPEAPLLSLSHSGTLGKRKQRAYIDMGNTLSTYSSSKKARTEGDPNDHHASSEHVLPLRPSPPTSIQQAHHEKNQSTQSDFNPPTGPRALRDNQQICFYWYHQGYCQPKPVHGQPKRCFYAHTVDVLHPSVCTPPPGVIRNHDPSCQLPLCPARLDYGNLDDMYIKTEPYIKEESEVSFRFMSSSPRASLHDDLESGVGPQYARKGRYQNLPQLTGEQRQRFKEQRNRLEQWQADNGIKLDMGKLERQAETRRVHARMKRQRRGIKKRAAKEQARRGIAQLFSDDGRQRSEEEVSQLQDMDQFRHGTPDTQGPRKSLERVYRAPEVVEPWPTGFVVSELPRQTGDDDLAPNEMMVNTPSRIGPRPIDPNMHFRLGGFEIDASSELPAFNRPDSEPFDSKHGGRRRTSAELASIYNSAYRSDVELDGQQRVMNKAPVIVERLSSAEVLPSAVSEVLGRLFDRVAQRPVVNPCAQSKKTRVLVNYELPSGSSRLDWDTDVVRRLFGEIA